MTLKHCPEKLEINIANRVARYANCDLPINHPEMYHESEFIDFMDFEGDAIEVVITTKWRVLG